MSCGYIYPVSEPVKGAGGSTGEWRATYPVVDTQKCTGCQLCWVFCSEAVIGRDTREIDLTYCKGCGVCAKECPVNAITMEKEAAR